MKKICLVISLTMLLLILFIYKIQAKSYSEFLDFQQSEWLDQYVRDSWYQFQIRQTRVYDEYIHRDDAGDLRYWYSVVDRYTDDPEENAWLRRVIKCESNGRSQVVNSLGYTGLMQWSPYYWNKQFPNDDIFDGEAQIKNSLWKYRQGGKGIWECK